MKKIKAFNKTAILNLFQNQKGLLWSLCRRKVAGGKFSERSRAENQYEFTNIRFSDEVMKEAINHLTLNPSPSGEGLCKKVGFTLAEVLITLTILGVVAAITVPSLQKMNYKRTQISRMAKGYAVLEKAAANIAEKTNCVGKDLKCTGLLDFAEDADLQKKFAEYSGFRLSRESYGSYFSIMPISYENAPEGTTGRSMRAFVTTPDNLAYSITYTGIRRNAPGEPNNITSEKAIRILVVTDRKVLYDENGKAYGSWQIAKNAIAGRNVFQFVMYDNFKVDPLCTVFGGQGWPLSRINTNWYFRNQDINNYCDPKSTNTMQDSCTCRIIRDGWKMNY